GLLEIANVPYVGCGVLASSIGMDKDVMKRLFLQAGLPVAPYRTIYAEDFYKNMQTLKRSVSRELGYPMFSKPANLGSSVGIRKIHSEKEFEASVKHSALFDGKIVIEKGLDARELECAVLGNKNPEASVVGEIIPAHEFYDYDAKYISPDSRLVIPAGIDSAASKRIRTLALQAFRAIEGTGLSRVDFFLERETGKIWVNEINTMPGFTPISMFAKLWASSGVSFGQLVRKLVDLGYERFYEKNDRRISEV
ncbi:MAG: D-alanine--D-alanine ligase, partial [Acidobacteriota bacterium]